MSEREEMRIGIASSTVVKVFAVFVLFVALYFLRDLLLAILTAIVVASSAEPFTRKLMQYLRLPRAAAVILVYLAVFVIVVGLLFVFLPPVADEMIRLSSTLPEQIGKLPIFNEGLRGSLAGERIGNYVLENLKPEVVLSGLGNALSNFGGGVATTAGAVFGSVFTFILVIVLSFYFAVQEGGIEDFLRLVAPEKHEDYAVSLWKRAQHKIGLWIQGQLLLAILIGVFVYLGLSIFGVQYALLLALWAAVMEVIPIFGPILAAVPAVLLAFSQGTTIGLAMIAFYVIIQQFENHLIYPLVVRKIVGVPPLLVIVALIIGARLAGFMGIILAVPLAAALMELVSDIEQKKRKPD